MIKRALLKTQFGKRYQTFSAGTTHRSWFGLFGLDSAGNVICLPMYRAGPTSGSWSVVTQDNMSYPMHWWAVAKRVAANNSVDVYDRAALCRSAGIRYAYKSVRLVWLALKAFFFFAVYVMVKQNLNLEARLVLLRAERALGETLQEALTTASGGDSSSNKKAEGENSSVFPAEAKSAVLSTGRAVRDVMFAVAEDIGVYSPELALEDEVAAAAAEKRISERVHAREHKKFASETQSKLKTWSQAAGVILSCAAVIFLF
jgi:hypothetical protein